MEQKGSKMEHSVEDNEITKKTAFPVELYIYDLSNGMARQFAPFFGINFEIEGIWHTSLVVHGLEWFFGSQGIQTCNPGGTLRQENMGSTSLSLSKFKAYLHKLGKDEFTGDKYDLFNHNCNTFTNMVSKHLTGKQIPQYILDLPGLVLNSPIVQMLKPIIQQATPQGTQMSESENDESTNQIFTKMKELDSKNDKDNQILTAENLTRIGQYLDRISSS